MIPGNESLTELEMLLESLCEDRLTSAEAARLEQLVISSPRACWQYLTYLDLHGTLYWDAAGAGSSEPLSSQEIPIYQAPAEAALPVVKPRSRRPWSRWMAITAASLIVVVIGAWQAIRPAQNQLAGPAARPSNDLTKEDLTKEMVQAPVQEKVQPPVQPLAPHSHGPPVNLADPDRAITNSLAQQGSDVARDQQVSVPAFETEAPAVSAVVARINGAIRARWTELEITPSDRSEDAEWLRRIYLDLVGRVPTVPEAEQFLADRRESKRDDLVEQLLNDTAYVRNFTTKWTNLLIGRSSNPLVDRAGLQKFLRLGFAANKPWNEMVSELISAEGSNRENGATNFLIAHLNNDATPATAVVSKLFLSRQVQCNQCHNNPFDESKQVAFWELNSFFQQTISVPRQRRDPETGRTLFTFTDLVTRDAGGPTYFETQSGLMRVAYPRFNGHDVDPSADTNRRTELARLMTYGNQPQLAAAFVNRLWHHFFGTGFTRDVDDLGPHQPHSHPELLAVLSEHFVRSGYDIKQLIRWICRSEAYHLSSRFSESNRGDDPSLGELPVFSRMYVKSMTAEQTYDSFLTATRAHHVGAVDWTSAEQNRQDWLKQFVVSFHTDENDEAMAFDGSIGNALSLMNGPLIEKALDISAGSFLGDVIRQKSSDNEKIRSLCLAALSRPPGASELTSMRKLIREAEMHYGGRGQGSVAYQDLFWALLNSNEFALIH